MLQRFYNLLMLLIVALQALVLLGLPWGTYQCHICSMPQYTWNLMLFFIGPWIAISAFNYFYYAVKSPVLRDIHKEEQA